MPAQKLIYLDYNSTTPVDPRVVEGMLPYFTNMFGNAASRTHPFGWQAEEAVKKARTQVANLIQVEPKEVIFTSGATESNNLALKGVFEMYHRKGNHIITTKTEHKAILDVCEKIEKLGGEITYLNVDHEGRIDLEQLRDEIHARTVLVSIMWANNEIGTIQDMKAIGNICEEYGVLFMSDATQAVGKIKVSPKEVGVHLMSFSAHKMYGPKGVGALYVSNDKPKVKLAEQINGGGHQRGLRSGTLNVPAIVGFGLASDIAMTEYKRDQERVKILRDLLEKALLKIEETYLNGDKKNRLENTLNISFRYVEGESLMMTFHQGIAVSSGSACTSASLEPSHVLQSIGLKKDMSHSSIRFSLGKYTTEEEILEVIKRVKSGVEQLRSSSPIWELFKDGVDVDNL